MVILYARMQRECHRRGHTGCVCVWCVCGSMVAVCGSGVCVHVRVYVAVCVAVTCHVYMWMYVWL